MGRSVQENHWYSKICPTQVKRKWNVELKGVSRGFNCKIIRLDAPLKSGSAYSFVAAFMLSNVMSLSPKIDEVRVAFAMQIWTSFASRKHGSKTT